MVPKHLIWVWKKTMAVLSKTISYHTFLIIPNRYENPAPGMKTVHLGMKWIPLGMKIWKMLWNHEWTCFIPWAHFSYLSARGHYDWWPHHVTLHVSTASIRGHLQPSHTLVGDRALESYLCGRRWIGTKELWRCKPINFIPHPFFHTK